VAEENNEAEDGQEDQEGQAAPKSKKGIIIIAAIALLAIALSIGVTLFLLGGDDETVDDEDTAEAEEMGTPVSATGPALYYEITPAFLAAFTIGSRQRYMQISVSVSSRDQAALDAVEYHMPLLKSKLNSAYSGQDFEQIQTEEGKNMLRERTLVTINEMLEAEGENAIENVFFTNFVLQ